jgi:succinate dehydrogenase flavin-adding protein (antitoxin of CptAB toxin-antitoxin module)
MRELDELLLLYLEDRYSMADEQEKAAFREVLALSDPELNAYLLQRHKPESEPIADVIQRILSQSQT